jgi:uncharacterized protein DUF202
MRKVYTVLEFFLSLMLIALGILVFNSGYFGSPQNSMFVLPVGAMFLVLGAVVLAYAIRSQIWHRRMMRERPTSGSGPMPEWSHPR